MPDLKFSDGMTINTDGPYRVILKKDGYYVVGHGFMCAVDSREDGAELIKDLVKET
jgi:hypothetical protein